MPIFKVTRPSTIDEVQFLAYLRKNKFFVLENLDEDFKDVVLLTPNVPDWNLHKTIFADVTKIKRMVPQHTCSMVLTQLNYETAARNCKTEPDFMWWYTYGLIKKDHVDMQTFHRVLLFNSFILFQVVKERDQKVYYVRFTKRNYEFEWLKEPGSLILAPDVTTPLECLKPIQPLCKMIFSAANFVCEKNIQ
jgi:hypothetical protein